MKHEGELLPQSKNKPICRHLSWYETYGSLNGEEISRWLQLIRLYLKNVLCPGSYWCRISICPWSHVHQHSQTIQVTLSTWRYENVRGKKLIYWQSFSISPLVHLKNERGDWISANDTAYPGGHSYPVHVLTLCWLFKRNLHVEGSLWNGPYYYLWSRERPCELF